MHQKFSARYKIFPTIRKFARIWQFFCVRSKTKIKCIRKINVNGLIKLPNMNFMGIMRTESGIN